MNVMNKIIFGDCLEVLKTLPEKSVDLIYIDPPFGTGTTRLLTRVKTTANVEGTRGGFEGKRYEVEELGTLEYKDDFVSYGEFLYPRLLEGYRVLKSSGSFYLHLDWRNVHRGRFWMDEIFGIECCLNEIIWAYDYGGKPKNRWPAKHDNILFYVKDPTHYTFNVDEIEREPYMAPGLVTPEKAERGKLPTDVWWHTIVPTNSYERTGYPTQKPLGVLNRIITASSKVGDVVLDYFAGSGTTGVAAYNLDRDFILIDNNRQAYDVMLARFDPILQEVEIGGRDQSPKNPD